MRYRIVFSRDFTAAMLVSLYKRTAAMLVYPTNPPGTEFHSYEVFSFNLFWLKNTLIDHVSENIPQGSKIRQEPQRLRNRKHSN